MLALDPLSDIERAFIRRVALEGKVRVDGRSRRESRELNIELLDDPGSCIVSLGNNFALLIFVSHSANIERSMRRTFNKRKPQ